MNPNRFIFVIAIWSALTCSSSQSGAAAPQQQPPAVQADASFDQLTEAFRNRYNIELTTSPPASENEDVGFKVISPRDRLPLERLQVIGEELARYSPSMLRATRVKKIALVSKLTRNNVVRPGTHTGFTYYVNVEEQPSEPFERHLFHYSMASTVLRRFCGEMTSLEPRWLTLNDPAFRYGGGGKVYRPSSDMNHNDAPRGFSSLYSRAGASEDKAEVFAMLMVPDDLRWMKERAARDPILAAKMKYMQSLIDYFNNLEESRDQLWVEALFDLALHREPREMDPKYLDYRDKILKRNGIINERGWAGRTALLVAVMENQTNLPQEMIRAGADVRLADEDGFTPLHAAGFMGNAIVVRVLLEAGADPAAKDRFGGTPLDWARQRNNKEAIAELMKLRPKSRNANRP